MDELARLQAVAKRVGVVADVRKAGEAEVDLGLRRGQAARDRDGEYQSAVQWGRMQSLQKNKIRNKIKINGGFVERRNVRTRTVRA